jgi:hypothetical protein
MGNALTNSIKKLINSGTPVVGIILAIIVVCAIAFGIDCFIVWIAMLLWNNCLTAVIPVDTVNFWPMYGLYLLSNILFKTRLNINKTEE